MKVEELNKSLKEELLKTENLETQMKKLQTENESSRKKVIICF